MAVKQGLYLWKVFMNFYTFPQIFAICEIREIFWENLWKFMKSDENVFTTTEEPVLKNVKQERELTIWKFKL